MNQNKFYCRIRLHKGRVPNNFGQLRPSDGKILSADEPVDTADENVTAVDLAMMERALAQARRALDFDEVPVGAVVYRGEEVLAEAHNLRETRADPTAHAEVVAIRLAAERLGSWRLDGCGLAVTLEPCPMCAGALVNSRVQRLIFGAHDPKMGAVRTLYELCCDRRFNHRLEVLFVDDPRCGQVLKDFFASRR